MRLLADSHVLLWLLFAPENLGPDARAAITSAESACVSVVSLWELALKHHEGKLPHSSAELADGLDALNLDELGLARRHLVALGEISLPHGDPFDALLLAQARADGLALVTADRVLLAAPYPTIDARH